MIVKGTGNSRYLRSVANVMTLYPSYESFLAALAAGTFPIDLNGINPAGVQQTGTRLNKASLLTDAAASALGLSASATPSQALDKLRQLVNTAQTGVNNGVKFTIVSYAGTGKTGASYPVQITFPFAPKLLMLVLRTTDDDGRWWSTFGDAYANYVILPQLLTTAYQTNKGFFNNYNKSEYIHCKKSSDGKTISFYNDYSEMLVPNYDGWTYHVAAFG